MSKTARSTQKQVRAARALPCSPEEMEKILADLRTLAMTVDVSPTGRHVRELALSVEESLGPVNGKWLYGADYGSEDLTVRPRTLSADEQRLEAIILTILDVVLKIRLGSAPADCSTKLSELAEALARLNTGGEKHDGIAPIKVKGLWSCKSLSLLRDLDADKKKEGIKCTRDQYKNCRDWLKRRHKRLDIRNTLSYKEGRMTTSMPYRSMFCED